MKGYTVYDTTPPASWNESIPIGCGRMGATFDPLAPSENENEKENAMPMPMGRHTKKVPHRTSPEQDSL